MIDWVDDSPTQSTRKWAITSLVLHGLTEYLSGRSGELFGMPGDAQNPIGIAVDLEIEAIMVVDAGLPYIRGFVVLLGPERGMLEV